MQTKSNRQTYLHDCSNLDEEAGVRRAKQLLRPMRSFLRGRVLDVGCSTGAQMMEMQSYGCETHGVDMGEDLIEICRSKGLQAEVGHVDGGLPFEDASFDTVLSSHTLEHVWGPFELLLEIHRVLKPGGNLVLILPNSHNLRRSAFMRGHVNYYDPDNIYWTMRASGFDPLYISTDFPMASRVPGLRCALTPGNWASKSQRRVMSFLPHYHLGINLFAVGRHSASAGPNGELDARGAALADAGSLAQAG